MNPFHYVRPARRAPQGGRTRRPDRPIPGPGAELLPRLLATSSYEGPLKLEFYTADWDNPRKSRPARIPASTRTGRTGPLRRGRRRLLRGQVDGSIRARRAGSTSSSAEPRQRDVNLDGKEPHRELANPDDTLSPRRPRGRKDLRARGDSRTTKPGHRASQFAGAPRRRSSPMTRPRVCAPRTPWSSAPGSTSCSRARAPTGPTSFRTTSPS